MAPDFTTRPLSRSDAPVLRDILHSPEVARWWHPPEEGFPFDDDTDSVRWTVEVDGRVAGMVQFSEDLDPAYRHASIDIFLAARFHGRGLGSAVVRRTASYLVRERGHHRITIDPARSNLAAIRAYEMAGFQPVGVMRAYERDTVGDGWHDGLLMELVVLPDGTRRPLDRADQYRSS